MYVVSPGTSLMFGWAVSPATVSSAGGDIKLGAVTNSSSWEITRPGGNVVGCPYFPFASGNNYRYCQVRADSAITVKLTAITNGAWKSKSIQVIPRRNFRLQGPSEAYSGDTLAFTAMLDGTPVSATRWVWMPNDTASHDTDAGWDGATSPQRLKIMKTSGRMTAYLDYAGGGTDSASVTVTVSNSFTLSASRTNVAYGDTVQFTPLLRGAPHSADQWRWQPQDTSVNEPSSCTQGTALCSRRMQWSGTMWAFVTAAGGGRDSASATVTVSAPDTSGGGIGCSMAVTATPQLRPRRGRRARATSAPRLDCGGTSGDPRLTVSCTFPSGSARGNPVDCRIAVSPAAQFRLLERSSTPAIPIGWDSLPPYALEYSYISQTESAPIDVPAGGAYEWTGPAVAQTQVAVTALVRKADGSWLQQTDSTAFTPTRRDWPRWVWDEATRERRDDSMTTTGVLSFRPFGEPPADATPEDSTRLGIFLPQQPATNSYAASTPIADGPNAGLLYLTQATPNPTYKIFLHPWITRPLSLPAGTERDSAQAWQARQAGGQATNLPWCDGPALDSMYRLSARHEGWSTATNSHWGIADSLFSAIRLQDFVETVALVAGTGQSVADAQQSMRAVASIWYRALLYNHSPYADPEVDFDRFGPDYPAMSNICTFRP